MRCLVVRSCWGRIFPQTKPNQITQRDLEFALSERETAELEAIDAALNLLDVVTYGVCADCSEPIAKARLLATPEVTRFIACQEKSEHLPH